METKSTCKHPHWEEAIHWGPIITCHITSLEYRNAIPVYHKYSLCSLLWNLNTGVTIYKSKEKKPQQTTDKQKVHLILR